MSGFRATLRIIWLMLILMFALLVGAAGGLLSWADTHRAPSAVLYGGGAFATTVGLALAVYHFLQQRP